MKKRIFCLLLTLILMLNLVPASALATSDDSVAPGETTAATTEPSVPETTVPETTEEEKEPRTPETTVPETTVPETTVPETTVPETTVPETTVPETTVPETTVPETTVPETTVPETTVPETTVPETTVPETTVPETTVPETTVPEETEAVCICDGESLVHMESCPLYVATAPAELYVEENGKYSKIELPVEIKKYDGKTLYMVSDAEHREIVFHYVGIAEIGAKFSVEKSAYWRMTTAEGGFAGLKNSAKVTLAPFTPDGKKIEVQAKLALGVGTYSVSVCIVDAIPESVEPSEEDLTIPTCDCGSDSKWISAHADACARKAWFRDNAVKLTAEQMMDIWLELTESERNYLKKQLGKVDAAKLEQLEQLVSKISDTIKINGAKFSLPGIGKVTELSEAKQEALYAALNPVSGFSMDSSRQYHFFDLKSDETGKIKISGLLDDNKNKSVIVYHLLKDASKIADNLPYMELSGEDFKEENAAAKEFSGVDGRVYYEIQIADVKKNGDITFTADSYSTFIFQVTFEYDGVEVTMAGMTGMKLSDLMESLNLKYNIKQVESVEFTDPSLISIEKENGDWMIQSLDSFSTTEWLILNFKDGTSLEIRVTDPPIYYYLSGTDWNMGTKDFKTSSVDGVTALTGNTYQRPTAPISNYGNVNGAIIQVYARPGTAIIGRSSITWPDGSWSVAKFNNKEYDHDGWTWMWDGTYNYALIDPNITEYKCIDIAQVNTRATDTESTNGHKYTLRIHVIPDYKPTLLKDALATSGLEDHLSIQTLPVSLFNFDAEKFNGDRAFQFKGVSQGKKTDSTTNNSGINSGGSTADMGILKPELNEEGYPEFALGDVGQTYVFDDSKPAGKEAYMNVPFEFIFDENTRTYYYSSLLNHAQLTDDGNGGKKVVLYKEGMSPTDVTIQHPNGLAADATRSAQTYSGYYPFADINKAFLSTNANEFNWAAWEKQLKIPYADMLEAGYAGNYMVKDLVTTSHVATTDNPKTSTINMHYGYSVDGFFYLPEGRQLAGEDMTYSFTGDDDLWVFIDGHLVLDIGGGHTPVIGSFNLKTGKVSISSAQKLASANAEGTVMTPYEYTDQFLLNLEDNMMHEIQIFYLERMSGESNCYMRFNLPIIPEQSVTVTNDIVDQTGHDLSIELMDPHKYQLKITKSVNEKVSTVIGDEEPYLLNGSEVRYTDENGYFYLKHGETAIFSDIPRFYPGATDKDAPTYVVVTQFLDKSLLYYKVVDTVNNVDKTTIVPDHTGIQDIVANQAVVPHKGNITVKFTNYIYADPMIIDCEVVGGRDGLVNPEQEFQYLISYEPQIMVHPDLNDPDYGIQNPDVDEQIGADNHGLTVTLKEGEQLVLRSVPRGIIFRLRAIDPDQGTVSSFDDPIVTYTYTDESDVEQGSNTNVLTFIGSGREHPEGAGLYIQQPLNPGSHAMKITNLQRGSILIQHEGNSNLKDPDQTYLYTIEGKDEHNKDISMDVVVKENEQVQVYGLIIGDYTVTQKDSWNWRYSGSASPQTVENTQFELRAGGYGKLLTYADTRSNPYWLDGNSWCRNVFGDTITAENLGGR